MYETPEKDRRVSATSGKPRNPGAGSRRESVPHGIKTTSALTDLA